ncbi:MAG: phosphate ABC transporter permease subunit PstC [Chitinispirillaceae bacterium]|nr:phosphate ABC transporter permease subunit PstC [Chitinispirillaceae bacterium]
MQLNFAKSISGASRKSSDGAVTDQPVYHQGVRIASGTWFEPVFGFIARSAAFLLIAIMVAIFLLLLYRSLPVFQNFGFSFITSSSWNPVTDKFGALAPISGTILTSIIAILFGAPLAIGVALFLNETCPFRLRTVLTTTIELLAAIPSIIYGMWGLFVLVPIMAKHIQPPIIDLLNPVPFLGMLFEGPPFGIGILTAGLILSIMILPFIASVSLQAFASVPVSLREAAYGTGASVWEVCRRIIIPYARNGIIGAIMLGLGRALGETMAVTFVIGNAHRIQASIFAPGTTISAALANEFTEAFGDMYIASLLALGLILFVITFFVLMATRILLHSINRSAVA